MLSVGKITQYQFHGQVLLGRVPTHTVGRCHCSCMGLFNHVHTPGYWVSSDAPPGIWKARNIIETRVPALRRRMMLEKQHRVVSGPGQWLTVLSRKVNCLLLFVRHKTGVIKPGISTKGPIVIKYYKHLCSFLQFTDAPSGHHILFLLFKCRF